MVNNEAFFYLMSIASNEYTPQKCILAYKVYGEYPNTVAHNVEWVDVDTYIKYMVKRDKYGEDYHFYNGYGAIIQEKLLSYCHKYARDHGGIASGTNRTPMGLLLTIWLYFIPSMAVALLCKTIINGGWEILVLVICYWIYVVIRLLTYMPSCAKECLDVKLRQRIKRGKGYNKIYYLIQGEIDKKEWTTKDYTDWNSLKVIEYR